MLSRPAALTCGSRKMTSGTPNSSTRRVKFVDICPRSSSASKSLLPTSSRLPCSTGHRCDLTRSLGVPPYKATDVSGNGCLIAAWASPATRLPRRDTSASFDGGYR